MRTFNKVAAMVLATGFVALGGAAASATEYGTPLPRGYAQQQSYATEQQSYAPQQQGYGEQQQGYAQPQQPSYAAPQPSYAQPQHQGYAQPQQSYAQPQHQGYAQPAQHTYAQPQHSYAQPEHSYRTVRVTTYTQTCTTQRYQVRSHYGYEWRSRQVCS